VDVGAKSDTISHPEISVSGTTNDPNTVATAIAARTVDRTNGDRRLNEIPATDQSCRD
jgi:hypothetical protein